MSDLQPWLTQLASADFRTRTAAAESLGRSGLPQARAALVACFETYGFMSRDNPQQNVFYFTAALVLAEMGHFHPYRLVVDEDAPFVRRRVVDILVTIGRDRAINAAVAMLTSPDAGERYWAAEILYALQATSASAALVQAFQAENQVDIRYALVRSLIQAGDPSALPLLHTLSTHPDAEISRLAGLAIAQITR